MKKISVKKLALAGMLCALCVVGSVFSFPMFGSKCAPIQHMVNVTCAVLLGPWRGVVRHPGHGAGCADAGRAGGAAQTGCRGRADGPRPG